jgi:fucose 4-O-acetylase-like acetyltransferase
MPTPQPRIEWLDVARGAGIVLVVAAHVLVDSEDYSRIGRFLYLFHMPMFFMASGYFLKPENPLAFAKRRAPTLLWPYLVFAILLGAVPILILVAKSHDFGSATGSELIRLVLGGPALTGILGVFWFVTCLFWAQTMYVAAANAFGGASNKRTLLAVFIITFVGLVAGVLQVPSPWSIANAPVAVLFLWLGALLRQRDWTAKTAIYFVSASIAAIAACKFFQAPLEFDMKAMAYGTPLVGLFIAFGLSLGFFTLCRLLAATKLKTAISYLGEASLIIMFLHQAVRFSLSKATGIDSPAILIVAGVIFPTLLYLLISRVPVLSFTILGKKTAK